MSRFLDNLRRLKKDAAHDAAAQKQEQDAQRQREMERDRLVDAAADALEIHIEQRLREFLEEFVEFRFESFSDHGRHLRVTFNEPPARSGPRTEQLHQLAFRVRRYRAYADVEVEAKMIIGNSERTRRLREEDVFEGDPRKLHDLVDDVVLKFSRLYLENRSW